MNPIDETEQTPDQCPSEPKISRRDLTRNVAKFGIVGALAVAFGLRPKGANAVTCYWSTVYTYCKADFGCPNNLNHGIWARQRQYCCGAPCYWTNNYRDVRLWCGC